MISTTGPAPEPCSPNTLTVGRTQRKKSTKGDENNCPLVLLRPAALQRGAPRAPPPPRPAGAAEGNTPPVLADRGPRRRGSPSANGGGVARPTAAAAARGEAPAAAAAAVARHAAIDQSRHSATLQPPQRVKRGRETEPTRASAERDKEMSSNEGTTNQDRATRGSDIRQRPGGPPIQGNARAGQRSSRATIIQGNAHPGQVSSRASLVQGSSRPGLVQRNTGPG